MRVLKTSVALLFVLGSLATVAQAKSGFGLKLGGGAATLEGPASYKSGRNNVYQGGALFEYAAKPDLGVQIELCYGQAGQWVDYGGGFEQRVTLNYVQLPIALRMKATAVTGEHPYFVLGIQPGLYLSGAVETLVGTTKLSTDPKYIDAFDLSSIVGFGGEFARGRQTFDIEARWTYSLLGIASATPVARPSDPIDLRNSVISLALSYKFWPSGAPGAL